MRKKKTSKSSRVDLTTLTPNSKTNALLQEHGFHPSKFPVNLRKQLLYADAISLKIGRANANSNTAKKQVVCIIVSGKIVKKYKLLKYVAKIPDSNRIKLSKVQNKSLSFEQKKWKAHPPKVDVVSFYLRHDVSTALPGKHDAKKISKRKCIQKRTLNDYLSNLRTTFLAEFPQHEISMSTFAGLRPSYCMLANFTNIHSYLCTKHQKVALTLKMLKWKKIVETENPDAFIRLKTDDQVKAKLSDMSKQWVT